VTSLGSGIIFDYKAQVSYKHPSKISVALISFGSNASVGRIQTLQDIAPIILKDHVVLVQQDTNIANVAIRVKRVLIVAIDIMSTFTIESRERGSTDSGPLTPIQNRKSQVLF